jgi:hypothetical protein
LIENYEVTQDHLTCEKEEEEEEEEEKGEEEEKVEKGRRRRGGGGGEEEEEEMEEVLHEYKVSSFDTLSRTRGTKKIHPAL